MNPLRRRLALLLAAICALLSSSLGAQGDDPLRAALAKRVDEAKQGTGVVIGLLTPEGRSFASYGRVTLDGPAVGPDTVAEIGSVGKLFTAFLLADMVERGEVALNDPVRKYLPASVKVPSRGGKEILLVDLATHFSGLPRDSVEVDLSKDVSPYVGYTVNDLYGFLGRVQLQRDPGSQADYSNVGVALLGHVLALRAGMTFEDLLRRRLLEPLGMTSTAITLTAEQRARQATGHNPKRAPVPPWAGGIMAPTGEAKSTASDMLKFAAAILDDTSPLKASFARMTSVRRPLEDSRNQQALGWAIFRRNRSEMLGHSGASFGFASRLVLDTTRKRAAIAWINGRGDEVGDLISLAIDRERLQ